MPSQRRGESRSGRAGLTFPVGRAHRFLRKGRYAERIGAAAPVYAMAVIEYLVNEVVELAGHAALEAHRQRITPRHLMLAIRRDPELSELLRSVVISEGGVPTHIEPVLLPRATQQRKRTAVVPDNEPSEQDSSS